MSGNLSEAASHYPGGAGTSIGLAVIAIIAFGIMIILMRRNRK